MEKTKMSMLDAFVALEDLDEDIQVDDQAGKLTEGKTFDVRDANQLKEAEEIIHEPKQELDLEVIDVDADTMNHLKDHKDYVGQMIMVCKACRTPHFMDPDHLEEDPEQEGVFNIETECPHCHQVGKGFECTTQVGAVAKEEPQIEEPTVTNDEAPAEEATIGNDFVPEEAPAEEETPVDEIPEDNPYMPHDEYNFEDRSYDDTNAEDDTADMEYKPGEDVNFDDVPWDDTEGEAPVKAEESEDESNEEDDKPEFVTIDKKEESLEEAAEEEINPEDNIEEEVLNISFVDFKNLITDIDKVKSFKVTDLEGNVLFDDSLEENQVPPTLDGYEVIAVDPRDTPVAMIVKESEPEETDVLVGDVLALLDDDVKVILQNEDGDDVATGSPEEVLDFEDWVVMMVEPNESMEVIVKDPESEETEEETEESTESEEAVEESFITRLFKANNLKEYKISKFGTEEYFLNESLRLGEDLEEIKDRYVTADLLEEFKAVTGFKESIDHAYEEAVDAFNYVDGAVGIIYGYKKAGVAYELPELKVCKTMPELNAATEAIRLRYHASIILVAYPDSDAKVESLTEDVKSDIVEPLVKDEEEAIKGYEDAKKDLESEENISVENKDKINQVFDHIAEEEKEHIEEIRDVTKDVVESFKDRKSLSAAINECKNNKQPYVVKRSMTKGYRFDLIREDVDDEVEQEVITPVENEIATVEPEAETRAVIDPRDAELVDKLMRISQNIASEIESAYGVHADPRAIMADMIQDLQLVSGQLTPEQIEDTPMNQLTKEMYQAYNGFYDAMDQMISFLTGEEIHTTQAQKLQHALASLDSEQFSPEMIAQNTRTPEFLRALQTGNVPGIEYQGNPQEIALIGPADESFESDEDDLADIEDDSDVTEPVTEAQESPTSPDDEAFVTECQNKINEYLDNEYEDTKVFVCEQYYTEGKDLVMLGDIEAEDDTARVSFKATESKHVNESTGADETTVEIKNTLTEEIIKFIK